MYRLTSGPPPPRTQGVFGENYTVEIVQHAAVLISDLSTHTVDRNFTAAAIIVCFDRFMRVDLRKTKGSQRD